VAIPRAHAPTASICQRIRPVNRQERLDLRIHAVDLREAFVAVFAFDRLQVLNPEIVQSGELEALETRIRSGTRHDHPQVHMLRQGLGKAETGNAETTIDQGWKFPTEFEHTKAIHDFDEGSEV
jgi:hypothetical protein